MPVKMMTFRKYRAFMWGLELDQLAKYVRTTKTALDGVAAEFSQELRDQVAQNPDAADWIYQEAGKEAIALEQIFPALNNVATFIAIYSFLEHQLVELCTFLQRRRKLGISVNDLYGGGIEQCRKYLEKGYGYRFPSQTKEWQEIKNLQRVRNLLVHRGGVVERNGDAEVKKYLARKKTAKVNGNEIVLTDRFCLDAIETVRAFLTSVAAMLPSNIQLRRRKKA